MVDQQPQMQQPQAVQPEQPKRGWWSRNWKWFVPTGCMSIILLVVGGCVALIFLGLNAAKSTEVYQGAIAKLNTSAAATDALGSPIEGGMASQANFQMTGASTTADLTINVKGPKGKGVLRVKATKVGTAWTYNSLMLTTEAGEIDALADQQAMPTPPALPAIPPVSLPATP